MDQPHEIVMDAVGKRWQNIKNRHWLVKLIDLGGIKPRMIIINHIEGMVTKDNCIQPGKTINTWKYDDQGLEQTDEQALEKIRKADYCIYYIDEDKKTIALTWAHIMPTKSFWKEYDYHHTGYVYDLKDKSEETRAYKMIECWME